MRITIQHLATLQNLIQANGIIFSPKELIDIINIHSIDIFNKQVSARKIIDKLTEKSFLFKQELRFIYKPVIRYTIKKDVDPYDIAISSRLNGFFSHYSALTILKIIPENKRNIFINEELKNKTVNKSNLTQNAITTAFSKPVRVTNSIVQYNEYDIYSINSKNTNKIDVKKYQVNDKIYYCSSIERALIESTIRPLYAGGIDTLVQAYMNSKNICDVVKMKYLLEIMNFTYPYTQVIGFLLDYCEYNKKYINLFIEDQNFDMYMEYNMKNPRYSKKWRLYYPNFL